MPPAILRNQVARIPSCAPSLDSLKSDLRQCGMPETIIIERLEFRGRCGVTLEERSRPQPLAADLELDYQLKAAGVSDMLTDTIDYAQIAQRIVAIGISQEAHLLETMAERFVAALFDEFPIQRVKVWVRKLHPPLSYVTGSVGVTIERSRLMHRLQRADPPPAPYLLQQLHRFSNGRALDVACGSGRHTLLLASLGYEVDALDRDKQLLDQLSTTAQARKLSGIRTNPIDLEPSMPNEPDLGRDLYDVILVFFYLARPLISHLINALKPGGLLLCETFTIDNHIQYHHPKRREFCLNHNELLHLISKLQILHYDEGLHQGNRPSESIYTAQLTARKPFDSETSQ